MWIIENPWPPVMILGVLALVFGIAWNAQGRPRYLLITIGLVLAAVVVWMIDEMVQTEGERVEAQVHALAEAVRSNQSETVLGFISDEAANLRTEIAGHIDSISVSELRITDLQVQHEPESTTAETHFRANGTATIKNFATQNFATRWNLTWSKTGEAWKITRIDRLDPIKGDVINTWSAM